MWERVADRVEAYIAHMSDVMVERLTDNQGRPVYSIELTLEEQIQRYRDPMLRHDRTAGMTDEELVAYLEKMAKETGE